MTDPRGSVWRYPRDEQYHQDHFAPCGWLSGSRDHPEVRQRIGSEPWRTVDNRLTAEDLYDGLDSAEMLPPTVSRTYEWNDAMSLVRGTRLDQAGTTTAISSESRRLHDDRNRTTSLDGTAIGWDANGNLVDLPALGAGRAVPLELTYDASNRLVGAISPEGSSEVIYDAFGRKIRRTVEAETVTRTIDYVLDGYSVLEEIENGSMAARYVLGRSPDEILRIEQAPRLGEPLENRLYPLQNELGNVEYLTDESGSILQRIAYEGFGEFRLFRPDGSGGWQSESTPRTHYLFQGREWLPELEAYDFRARTLWPQLASFGQEDPSGFADHANLYQAFMANPYEYTDPSGRVVVLMHGIKDDGGTWAQIVGQALGEEWSSSGADPGQDVINLVNQHGGGGLFWDLRESASGGLIKSPCPRDAFCFGNAADAGRGLLDQPTINAGDRTAAHFKILRGLLDSSRTRKTEPLQVLAHSHGTAMLLAASRQNGGRFHLSNIVLAGSDLSRLTDISAFFASSTTVWNLWSSADRVTRYVVQAGGGWGFQARYETALDGSLGEPYGESLGMRLRPNVPGRFYQEHVPGVRHAGDPLESRIGKRVWMSRTLAESYYAPIFALWQWRQAGESREWLRTYEGVRRAMGLHEVIDLPQLYKREYP